MEKNFETLLNEINQCEINIDVVLPFKKRAYVRNFDWNSVGLDKEKIQKELKKKIIFILKNKL